MGTTVVVRTAAPRQPLPRPESRRASPQPNPRFGRAALTVAVAGFVVVLLLGTVREAGPELRQAGGVAMFVGGMAGLAGMYLALVMLLLISRIPAIERILGQDGLVRWHRRLGPWPISLLVAHAVLITFGFAQAAKTGALHELGVFVLSYPDMLPATVGLALMVMAGVASVGALRNRMRRETWWVVHLYMYLALALSFAHVLALGPTFVDHPLTEAVWAFVWAATAGTVLSFRVGLPLVRTFRHRLRVADVRVETPGVVSVILKGRRLERLRVSGGQFFAWRFLTRGMWWQAHPYSLSAMPRPPYLRLSVRGIGDHSTALARLRPGTRVAIEGPYGAFTSHARTRERVLLVAAGIGVTAVRALLEDLPQSAKPIVVMRATSATALALHEETAELVRRLDGSLHVVLGPRTEVGNARTILRRLVPDLSQRDVYVCGPPGFVEEVVAAVHVLGVPQHAVHHELYRW